MPSHAPAEAWCFAGEVRSASGGFIRRPKPDDSDFEDWGDGDWRFDPSGDGHLEEVAGTESKKPGTIAVLTGNWGQNWKQPKLPNHMNYDLKSGAASIIVLQETTELLQHLQKPGEEGAAYAGRKPSGGGVNWQKRPTSQHIGVRRKEDFPSTLLVAARTSLVQSVRVLLFQLRVDGSYKSTNNRKGKTKIAPNKNGAG